MIVSVQCNLDMRIVKVVIVSALLCDNIILFILLYPDLENLL